MLFYNGLLCDNNYHFQLKIKEILKIYYILLINFSNFYEILVFLEVKLIINYR